MCNFYVQSSYMFALFGALTPENNFKKQLSEIESAC